MPAPESDGGIVGSPRSDSAIVGDTVTGHHVLHVDCYSRTKQELPTRKSIDSRPFVVGDRSFLLRYYPNGQIDKYSGFISVFLVLGNSVAVPFRARAKFGLLDREGNQVPSHIVDEAVFEFFVRGAGFGCADFIRREWLEKSEHLVDDSFKIRCDVTILEALRTVDRPTPSPRVVVPPSDLNRHLGELLAAEDNGADVAFKVAGETFRAHRYILKARSPVFKAELFGTMRESTATIGDCIRIDDMLPEVFKALLHFVYTDSLPEMEKQEEAVMMAQHLLEAADRYDMPRLKLLCEAMLCGHIQVSTAATTLVLAEQHHCKGLKDACIQFLESPDALDAVLATDGFDHLTSSCPALVKELMSKLAARSHKRRKLRI